MDLPPTGERRAETLGRYKILDELGRGGCGVVYRALDPSIGRIVAIKTILARTEGEESRERFRREARSAGNLSHPNIVTVHDFSDSGDPMFIAMEFVEGRTLAEMMLKGPLAMDFILGVLRSAADALDYAHARRIVHRDVKPANFLITEAGRLKITDFGIAKMLDNESNLTSAGMLIGTAQYMSPEQIAEAPLTGRSDQFSLAVIAYEMLAGVKPFQGNSWASVIHAIIESEPPPISLGDPVNAVLRKALSKAPDSRYTTCTEFCGALAQAIAAKPIEKTEIYVKPPPAKPVKAPSLKPVFIGAAGGAVLAVGLWIALRSRSAPPRPAIVALRTVPSAPPVASIPPTPVPRPVATPVRQAAKPLPEPPTAVPTPIPSATPSAAPAVERAAPPPVVQVPREVITPPPTPTPAPVPPVPPKPTPDDQIKRAADEQAKRVADEQARSAIVAENAAIGRALRDYQEAYERRDLASLQKIWPSISKQALDGVRSSFREASELNMDLRPIGDPKITGGTATIFCDRNLRQVIMKRVLEASGRVRIVLNRAGTGWTIQSVVPVSQ